METQAKNPYQEVLQMFVNKEELNPDTEWYMNPFVIDDRLFSTNRVVLVWMDKNKADNTLYKSIETDKSEKILSFIPSVFNLEKNIPIANIQQALDKCPQEDEMKWVGKDIVCTECNGEGEVEWEYKHHTKDFECPKCHGEGYSSKAKQVPTGRTMPKKYTKVKVSQCYIAANILAEIVRCATLLEKEVITLVHQKEALKPSIFMMDDVYFLVMPMLKDEYDFYEVVEIII